MSGQLPYRVEVREVSRRHMGWETIAAFNIKHPAITYAARGAMGQDIYDYRVIVRGREIWQRFAYTSGAARIPR